MNVEHPIHAYAVIDFDKSSIEIITADTDFSRRIYTDANLNLRLILY
jgi:hypothetical protein